MAARECDWVGERPGVLRGRLCSPEGGIPRTQEPAPPPMTPILARARAAAPRPSLLPPPPRPIGRPSAPQEQAALAVQLVSGLPQLLALDPATGRPGALRRPLLALWPALCGDDARSASPIVARVRRGKEELLEGPARREHEERQQVRGSAGGWGMWKGGRVQDSRSAGGRGRREGWGKGGRKPSWGRAREGLGRGERVQADARGQQGQHERRQTLGY
jgi:hypothetical protein